MIYVTKLYLNYFYNFITFSSFFFIFFFILSLLLFFFSLAKTIFFKIIITLTILINLSFLISYLNGDFFSAFLLNMELPVILIFFLFFFYKNTLNIYNIYILKKININLLKKMFYFILLYFLFFKKDKFLFEFFNYNLIYSFSVESRNDLYLFFYFFYINNISYICILGFFIFLISIFIIFFNHIYKNISFFKFYLLYDFIFLRKQYMFKQSIFNSKIFFYKKI